MTQNTDTSVKLSPEVEARVQELRKRYLAKTDGPSSDYSSTLLDTRVAAQPTAFKALSGLSTANSRFYATQSRINTNSALIKELTRQLDNTQNMLNKINYIEINQPGVIPRTLEDIDSIIKRFNTEEQPRIENIMDTVNGNLEETSKSLHTANSFVTWLDGFIQQYKLLIAISMAIIGIAIAVTIILIPIVLLRIVIFGF